MLQKHVSRGPVLLEAPNTLGVASLGDLIACGVELDLV